MVINIKLAFAELLIALCEQKGLKPRGRQAAIVRFFKQQGISISQPAIKKWFDGESLPEMDKAIVLARFFNCQVNDLLNGNKIALSKPDDRIAEQITKQQYSDWPFGDRVNKEEYYALDKDQQETIIARVLTFIDENKQKKQQIHKRKISL